LTSGLTNLVKPQDPDTEIVVSPTRTLFPSVSHNVQKAETIGMSHAKAASLRHCNQQLEAECDNWRKKFDELETKYHELEKKYKDQEKDVANRIAAGADW
jgi:t-SNARE complex subunit (syntaxin)